MNTNMNRERFFYGLLRRLSTPELQKIQEGYYLCKESHRAQKRDCGRRYFEHPRDVAILLIEHGYDDYLTIVKALLHDIVEDTTMPSSIIVNLFGVDVWKSVLSLSKVVPVFDPVSGFIVGRIRKSDDEYFQMLRNGPRWDQLIKCADRICNMRDMRHSWAPARRKKYALETQTRILPIAYGADIRFWHILNELTEKELASGPPAT